MPRLRQKTRPMQIGASEGVDSEEEVAKYKKDIQKDIENYNKQIYVAPPWVKEVLGDPHSNEDAESNHRQTGAASSSWEAL